MLELKQRVQSLNDRERAVLGWGIVGALLILAYTFVWQPWQDELNRLRVQIPLKQETLVWMRRQQSEIEPLLRRNQSKKQLSSEPLLTIIERSAQQSDISSKIRRMAPDEDGRVNIWLSGVDFDQWIVWLERLRQIGIEVNSASINRSTGSTVTVRVTLQR